MDQKNKRRLEKIRNSYKKYFPKNLDVKFKKKLSLRIYPYHPYKYMGVHAKYVRGNIYLSKRATEWDLIHELIHAYIDKFILKYVYIIINSIEEFFVVVLTEAIKRIILIKRKLWKGWGFSPS